MTNTIFRFLIVLTSFLFLQKTHSTHIIGGELYYECLGFGADTTSRKYKITIKLYRDCYSGQAGFDQQLGFTIFRQSGNQYINTRSGNGSQSEYRIQFDGKIYNMEPPEYPCLELPENICGEFAIYDTILTLPIINENYLIVWQRCCRNNTITNILDPGGTGATYSIEIHPEAQRTCNSSPAFINFPPTILCVNAPFKFDHAAIDKEGDLLVYQFCEPLKGGGPSANGGAGCNSPTPTPDCKPPYPPVDYNFPYSAVFPLGGNPPITIGTSNGLISGTPDIIGQYVVSVCVYEYRNGVLLSVLKRDFQFNVASCDGVIEARLVGAKQLTPDRFEITLCGTNAYQILNASIDSRFIHETMWTYENGGRTDTFFGWAPYIEFEEGGWHAGKFIINPNTNCGDTGYFRINVIPDIKPDFTAVYDTCNAGPVQLIDKSSSSYSNILNWNWSAGDGITAFNQNPQINYLRPGTYPVLLTIKDNYGCEEKHFQELKWYPAPQVIVFRPNVNEGCIPLEVEFKNVSFPTDNSYKFVWRFSDGGIDSGYTIKHIFKDQGVYDMKLEVTSPLGCYNEGDFKNVIYVYDPPVAEWTVDTHLVNFKNPIVNLKDDSKNTVGRTWIIGGEDYYFDPSLQLVLDDTGYHNIKLVVSDRFLCTDTLETQVYVFRDFTLFMPNAFTPNGDDRNNIFEPVGQINSLESYSLSVYDRWGGRVFHSTNVKEGWNGKFENHGKDLPPGTYVYELKYKRAGKEAFQERKFVNLLK